MRTGVRKGAAPGMVAVVVAMLLSGCGGVGESEEERTDRAMKAILKEYRPRFEQRRAALAAAAARLPKDSPDKNSCARKLDPQPEFRHFDHKSLVLDSYNSPDQGGNVDIASANEAHTPERIADDPGWTLGRFAVAPGWLIRGMWITGPQGPLGTNRFEVTGRYGYEPYKGVEKDPSRRLRKILDVGLHKRYAALFRVTAYREPGRPGDEAAVVKADVFLADLEKGDIPCRLTATGEPLFVKGHWYSTTPYEDMQTSFQLDISSKLAAMTRS
ncbi:hypothetical protein [Streptomyces sp. P17]|uniref:hypothetical protein n=1 Tax=Streptomyces sp. P17 TaxID=3074716 RepID=UPI0028F41320|nr:hypothetical protein [Streptomyces sp. P17]MDT9700963.1 hypothetical protein [Streptomyces sp. P17]